MRKVTNPLWKLRIWSDAKGQDLIEYALIAGFVVVACGAVIPGFADSMKRLFSKIGDIINNQKASVAG